MIVHEPPGVRPNPEPGHHLPQQLADMEPVLLVPANHPPLVPPAGEVIPPAGPLDP
jgi:hypothetical protein